MILIIRKWVWVPCVVERSVEAGIVRGREGGIHPVSSEPADAPQALSRVVSEAVQARGDGSVVGKLTRRLSWEGGVMTRGTGRARGWVFVIHFLIAVHGAHARQEKFLG